MKYRVIKKYDFKIHTMISLFVSILITIKIRYTQSAKGAYVEGIIGGASGPTSIYLCESDNISYFIMKCILVMNEYPFIPLFIILVLLYKPVKYIIQK